MQKVLKTIQYTLQNEKKNIKLYFAPKKKNKVLFAKKKYLPFRYW